MQRVIMQAGPRMEPKVPLVLCYGFLTRSTNKRQNVSSVTFLKIFTKRNKQQHLARLPGRTVELIILAKRIVHCTITPFAVSNTLLVDCAVIRVPRSGAELCTNTTALGLVMVNGNNSNAFH
jgi:hypothetical protein